MTANLEDLYQAVTELTDAARNVLDQGWPAADQLRTALDQNLAYLATGRDRADDVTRARIGAHHTCLECRAAYSAAIDAPDRPELQRVFIETARLLSARLFDVRQLITVKWS